MEEAGQFSTCNVDRTTVSSQQLRLRLVRCKHWDSEKQSSRESWMAWHKDITRSSEEVRGVQGRIQKLQDDSESSSQRDSPICEEVAKWLISVRMTMKWTSRSQRTKLRRIIQNTKTFEQHGSYEKLFLEINPRRCQVFTVEVQRSVHTVKVFRCRDDLPKGCQTRFNLLCAGDETPTRG